MKRKNNGLRHVICSVLMKEKLLSIVLLLCMAGAVVFTLIPPMVLEKIVNNLTQRKTITLELTCLYFLMLVISGLLDAVKEMLVTIFGQKITHGLRTEMCHKLSRIHSAYYINQEPGKLTSRMINDVDTVEQLFTNGIISMGVDVCKVISIVLVIFMKSKGLGIMLVIAAPMLYALTRLFQKRMLKTQLKNRVAIGKVTQFIPETIGNIRTIHCLTKEKYMEERYDQSIQDSYRAVDKANIYDSVYSPIIITISAVMIGTLMILATMGGAIQQFFGMSVGAAVAVIAYVGKVFGPIESIGMEIQNIQSAVAGVARINELLGEEDKPLVSEREHADIAQANAGQENTEIQFSKVDFSYDGLQKILTNLSLSIRRGEHVTLAGRTGAGKSTIFRLLLGMYVPEQGTIYVRGRRAHEIPDEEKRQVFGYVEQTFHMIAGTVAEQISMGDRTISREAIEEAAKLTGIHEHILQLPQGYDTLCQETLFSQGQFQLLSIARAIAGNPPIMLLDEITANLDTTTEQKVLDAMERAAEGRTVISISHRLYERGNGRLVMI